MIRTLSAVALAAASLLASSPANAACLGEQRTFYVCASLPGVTLVDDTYCVYAGGDDCTQVVVPVPQTSGGVDVDCGGSLRPAVFGAPPVSLGPGYDPWC